VEIISREVKMGLLAGLKMVDLSRYLPGTYCSYLLADLGMEVLKIENPEQGDYLQGPPPDQKKNRPYFLAMNQNKKSMTLNLKTKEGKNVFYKLIEKYDVVLESFRPGVMDSLGVGYQELKKINPNVILCSISGYGQDGPYRERAGHDINYIGLGGILELTGLKNMPPTIPGVQIADIGGGGMMAAIAILAAVIHRAKTGEGQYLDVSMLDGVISWISRYAVTYFMEQEIPKRGDMIVTGRYACYHVYRTRDRRYMSLGAMEEKFWRNFCMAIDRKDFIQGQFIEGGKQVLMIQEIQKLFKTKTQKEWVDFFKNADACCEPILTIKEVFCHPQVLNRQMVKEIEHPIEGKIRLIGNPIKSSQFSFENPTPPPLWGEHTTDVLKTLGYSEKDIQHLREVKVV
jgi:crotonobetainyl-CoA:carnitine CoA-transferase CaiB-like acyl-CoA transferase